MESPKVFLSHASEDKERFVVPFATELRAKGVDVWLDRWEIQAGDSLVDKIFEGGIGGADAFLIVLSKISVQKEWVREELNTAVVERIQKGTKLIPVVLDGVEVPTALRSTVWVNVERTDSYDDALREVVDSVFGVTQKPALGSPPGYLTLTIDALPGLTRTDTLVLKAICEIDLNERSWMVRRDALEEALREFDLPEGALSESIEVLESSGYIKPTYASHGEAIAVRVRPHGFSEYARSFIRGFAQTVDRIAFDVINSTSSRQRGGTRQTAETLDLPHKLVARVVEMFDRRGWVRATQMADGSYLFTGVSAEMKRAYRGKS